MCRPCALQTIGEKKGAHPHIHIHTYIYLFAYVFNTAAASHPLLHGLFLPSSPFFFAKFISMIYSPTFILQIVVYVLYSLYSYVYGELKEEEDEKNRMIVVRYTYKHYASMRWLRNV